MSGDREEAAFEEQREFRRKTDKAIKDREIKKYAALSVQHGTEWFQGSAYILSNMYRCRGWIINGYEMTCLEHARYYMEALERDIPELERRLRSACSGFDAKDKYKQYQAETGLQSWPYERVEALIDELLEDKANYCEGFKYKLVRETGDRIIWEATHDNEWGCGWHTVSTATARWRKYLNNQVQSNLPSGMNRMGRLLMRKRAKWRREEYQRSLQQPSQLRATDMRHVLTARRRTQSERAWPDAFVESGKSTERKERSVRQDLDRHKYRKEQRERERTERKEDKERPRESDSKRRRVDERLVVSGDKSSRLDQPKVKSKVVTKATKSDTSLPPGLTILPPSPERKPTREVKRKSEVQPEAGENKKEKLENTQESRDKVQSQNKKVQISKVVVSAQPDVTRETSVVQQEAKQHKLKHPVQTDREVDELARDLVRDTHGDTEKMFEMLERRDITFRVFKKALNDNRKYREYTARLRKETRQRTNMFPVFERAMAMQVRWLHKYLETENEKAEGKKSIDAIESDWGNTTIYKQRSNKPPCCPSFKHLLAVFVQNRTNASLLNRFGLSQEYWHEISDLIENGECDLLGSVEPENREVLSVTIQQPQPEKDIGAQADGGEEDERLPEEYVVLDEIGVCDSDGSESKEEEKEEETESDDDVRSVYGRRNFIGKKDDDDPFSEFGSKDWGHFNVEVDLPLDDTLQEQVAALEEPSRDKDMETDNVWDEQEEDSYGVSTNRETFQPYNYYADKVPTDVTFPNTLFIGDSHIERMPMSRFPGAGKIIAKTEANFKALLRRTPVSPTVRHVVVNEGINEILDPHCRVIRNTEEVIKLAGRWEDRIDELLEKFPRAQIYISLPFACKMVKQINEFGNRVAETVQKKANLGYQITSIKHLFTRGKFRNPEDKHLKNYEILAEVFQKEIEKNAPM